MKYGFLNIIIILLIAVSCRGYDFKDARESGAIPAIFPDYTGVTIPSNIAPLNFRVSGEWGKSFVIITGKESKIEIKAPDNKVIIPAGSWRRLLEENKGQDLNVEILTCTGNEWSKHRPFTFHIAGEPVDGYIVYRNLMPGYQNWNRMGIYQRSVADYEVKTVIDSRLMPGTCMNCHSFANNNPDKMVLHLRESYGGTIIYTNGKIVKLNTKVSGMFASAAFPFWHPSGRYIVFSVNKVNQIFHAAGPSRAAALDLKSDLVLYDIDNQKMKIPESLSREDKFETFPCFSPEGKTLYYCSADARRMPAEFDKVKYSLCSVSFDEKSGEFGTQPDTLISSSKTGRSFSIPRISPDGRYLMFNVSDFGAFPGYNPEADLWMMDLSTHNFYPLDSLNSSEAESYHSWSSNSCWTVFTSRRMDGLFSNLYIGYIDEEGRPAKPFLLPQKDPDFYMKFLFSFNVPEFTIRKVEVDPYQIERTAKSTSFIQVQSETSH